MIIAAIDIGTNSTRLLLAEPRGIKGLKIYEQGLVTTRIGQGSGGDGNLSPEGMARTLEALHNFSKIIQSYPVDMVRIGATSAVRDAGNQDEFVQRVKAELGWDVEILSGPREARLSYLGVTQALVLPPNPLVIDVGGGSTEAVWQEEGQVQALSVNAGAVRMTDRDYSREEIYQILQPVLDQGRKINPGVVIGVGGTVTTLAAVAQQLKAYDPEKIHGYNLSANQVSQILRDLAGKAPEQRRRVPGLQPQRADIIVAGITIVDIILSALKVKTLIVSESDLLTGLVIEALKPGLT